MTCAEARRQLSEPDSARAAEIAAHLEGCAPCRGESESLKEVDRRLVRLGEVRRGAARAVWARDPALGRSSATNSDGARGKDRDGGRELALQNFKESEKGKAALGASEALIARGGASFSSAPSQETPSELVSSPHSAGRFVLLFCLISLLVSSLLWLLLRMRH